MPLDRAAKSTDLRSVRAGHVYDLAMIAGITALMVLKPF